VEHVTAMRRSPNPYSTLSPTEVLELELGSGGAVAVFVKRLGEAQPDHPDKRQREREPLLYESLLAGAGLPVPRCLGIGRDEHGRARELYLEHIDGLDLRYRGLEHWYATAAQLAGLHRRFAAAGELDDARELLLTLDERYFVAWAERAAKEIAALHPAPAERLARLVERIEPAAALLAAQPATLVHNDLSPKNAMTVDGGGPPRVAFVDWELASAGCGALDVVHLAYGLDPVSRRRLLDVYWLGLDGSPLAVAEGSERAAVVAACELHKTLYRLAHAGAFGSDEATVSRWVEEAESWRSRL
jgi:Phosphotransferase enzyme family